jgi:hypothetical protein
MISDCVASRADLALFAQRDFDELRVMFQACAEFFEGCTMA